MIRRTFGTLLLGMLLAVSLARAGTAPVPPQVLAMWNEKDGGTLRTELRRIAALAARLDATGGTRMDAGEACYWLGVQYAYAGLRDSALVQWRRAAGLRGAYEEQFAVIDELFRRGRPADLREARVRAQGLAKTANSEMPQLAPDAHARFAWALFRLGRADSALAELAEHREALLGRPQWARRITEVDLAAGDTVGAWSSLVTLSVRTRRSDPELEAMLLRAQAALHFTDGRREVSVGRPIAGDVANEKAFAQGLGGAVEALPAGDGVPLQVYTFQAVPNAPRRTPCLILLAPEEPVSATDSLVAGLARAGHPVALFAPRGTLGSLGPGASGPEAWAGHEASFEALTLGDATRVMEQLAKRPAFAGGPWIVGAVGERARSGLALARAQRATPALLLVAPRFPLVLLPEFRAALRELAVRTFIQVAPEERDAMESANLISRDTPPGQVRVADTGRAGHGAGIFRADTKAARRLVDWLAEMPPEPK